MRTIAAGAKQNPNTDSRPHIITNPGDWQHNYQSGKSLGVAPAARAPPYPSATGTNECSARFDILTEKSQGTGHLDISSNGRFCGECLSDRNRHFVGGRLKDRVRAGRRDGGPPGAKMLADLDHAALAVQASQIDRKAEKAGVDRVARHQQQPAAVRQTIAKLKAHQPRPETVRYDQPRDNHLAGFPNDQPPSSVSPGGHVGAVVSPGHAGCLASGLALTDGRRRCATGFASASIGWSFHRALILPPEGRRHKFLPALTAWHNPADGISLSVCR